MYSIWHHMLKIASLGVSCLRQSQLRAFGARNSTSPHSDILVGPPNFWTVVAPLLIGSDVLSLTQWLNEGVDRGATALGRSTRGPKLAFSGTQYYDKNV